MSYINESAYSDISSGLCQFLHIQGRWNNEEELRETDDRRGQELQKNSPKKKNRRKFTFWSVRNWWPMRTMRLIWGNFRQINGRGGGYRLGVADSGFLQATSMVAATLVSRGTDLQGVRSKQCRLDMRGGVKTKGVAAITGGRRRQRRVGASGIKLQGQGFRGKKFWLSVLSQKLNIYHRKGIFLKVFWNIQDLLGTILNVQTIKDGYYED
jgi:hypothetical protein